MVFDSIKSKALSDMKKGLNMQPVLIFIDDCSGTQSVQTRRMGSFAHLAVQTTHWNASIVLITQQASSVDPNFRNNAENIIVFYAQGKRELNWLNNEYRTLRMAPDTMQRVMETAWTGGTMDPRENGKHFLFIRALPREPTRFYINFERQITFKDGNRSSKKIKKRKNARVIRVPTYRQQLSKRFSAAQKRSKRPRECSSDEESCDSSSDDSSAEFSMEPAYKKRKKMGNPMPRHFRPS